MKTTNIEQVEHIIEQVEHIYLDGETYGIFSPELWIVYYSSGKERQFEQYDKLPKTVKTFLKTHYDFNTPVKRCTITKYIYKAINIIK